MNRAKCTEALAVKVLFNGAPLAGCQLNAGKEGTLAKTETYRSGLKTLDCRF